MTTRPTIVLVPGAGHAPETWDRVSKLLEAEQLDCISIDLPTTHGDPSATFVDDVKVTRDTIESKTSQGLDVVVVVHSYGGWVGQSAMKGFAHSTNEAAPEGKPGHVIGLVLIASTYCQTGLTFLDAAGGKPPTSWRFGDSGFLE
jgi:pimeloyl-ACP methyl ester carboxylesterase